MRLLRWPLVCLHNFCEAVPLENSFLTDSRAIPAANITLLSYTTIWKIPEQDLSGQIGAHCING